MNTSRPASLNIYNPHPFQLFSSCRGVYSSFLHIEFLTLGTQQISLPLAGRDSKGKLCAPCATIVGILNQFQYNNSELSNYSPLNQLLINRPKQRQLLGTPG